MAVLARRIHPSDELLIAGLVPFSDANVETNDPDQVDEIWDVFARESRLLDTTNNHVPNGSR